MAAKHLNWAAAAGAKVIGIDIRAPENFNGTFVEGDLSNPDGITKVVARLPDGIDAVANVAGVSGTGGAKITLAINFYGLRAFTEAVVSKIVNGGTIVNVASIAGYGWRANLARAKAMVGASGYPDIDAVIAANAVKNEEGYPLSKELLLLWTMQAAHQSLFKSRGIRVNAVSPGPVETPILTQFRAVLGDAKVDSDIARTGRSGASDDIAPVILFLASEAARWINGANVPCDGGLEALHQCRRSRILISYKTYQEFPMDISMIINGKAASAASGATFERLDPFTGKVATRAPAAGLADVDAAVAAASAAFPAWSRTGPGARRAILNKAADILASKVDEFIRLTIEETGGTGPWGGFNVMLSANMLREAASMVTQIQGEIIPSDKPGSMAMGIRQAAGVCLAMAPWNAPVILGTRSVAMAIACGNTVVMKASEQSPGIHVLIGQCLVEAGVPDGVINVITNDPKDAPEIVQALIAHRAVKRVNFTGSTKVGRIIAEACGRHLKPALLELGGKAPLIVLEDADIDAAVGAATPLVLSCIWARSACRQNG